MSTIKRIKIRSSAKKPNKRKINESIKSTKRGIILKYKINEDIEGLDDLGSQFDGQPTPSASLAAKNTTTAAAQTAVKTPKKRGPKPKTDEVRPDDEEMNNRWKKLYAGMTKEEIDQLEKVLDEIETNPGSDITINDAFVKNNTKRLFASNLVKSTEFTADEKYVLCLLMGIPLTWVTNSEVPLEVIGKMLGGISKQAVFGICDRAIKKMQANAGMKNPTGMKAFKGMKMGKVDMPSV